jgi:hypothetical protein
VKFNIEFELPSAQLGVPVYASDGMVSIHAPRLEQDPAFNKAYDRGLLAHGTYIGHWRVHVALWCAEMALRLGGSFVECGVNKGFMASAIMERFDWNAGDKDFYLIDKFAGGDYTDDVGAVRANFAQWPRAKVIVGVIPEVLVEVPAEHIAFLHIDLNSATPEIAALTYFWDRLSPGAPILLDDYCYQGYGEQRLAMNDFAKNHGASILALPTGQGLVLR